MEKGNQKFFNTDYYSINENLLSNLNSENSEIGNLDNIRPDVNNQINEVSKTFYFITKSEENFSCSPKEINDISSKQDDDLYFLNSQIDSLNDSGEETNLRYVANIQNNKNH